MKVTADTNVLVRAMVDDHEHQSRLAREVLADAKMVVLTLTALCELVWVLSQGYRIASEDVVRGVRRLADSTNVVFDRPAVEAGLAMLEAGGDFADGVIAHEGSWLGADSLVSFDRKAVKLLTTQGKKARLLA